jgi:hypothetical protein
MIVRLGSSGSSDKIVGLEQAGSSLTIIRLDDPAYFWTEWTARWILSGVSVEMPRRLYDCVDRYGIIIPGIYCVGLIDSIDYRGYEILKSILVHRTSLKPLKIDMDNSARI